MCATKVRIVVVHDVCLYVCKSVRTVRVQDGPYVYCHVMTRYIYGSVCVCPFDVSVCTLLSENWIINNVSIVS